jgi:hypothetical protein
VEGFGVVDLLATRGPWLWAVRRVMTHVGTVVAFDCTE